MFCPTKCSIYLTDFDETVDGEQFCFCENGFCFNNTCTCDVFYENIGGFCSPCPEEGLACGTCCFGDNLECLRGTCV